MEKIVLLAGVAGQGMQSTGLLLSQAAVKEGKDVCCYRVLSGSRRSGITYCYLTISDDRIGAPERSKCDCVVMNHEQCVPYFFDHVLPGGMQCLNSDYCSKNVPESEVPTAWVSFSHLAIEAGSVKTTSVVTMGFVNEAIGIASERSAKEALQEKFKAKPQLLEINLRAYDAGAKAAREFLAKV